MARTKGTNLLSHFDNYTVIDTETTGLNPKEDRIIQISCVKIRNRTIWDQMTTLINPGCEISSFIENLTGISNEMVAYARPIGKVAPQIQRFIDSDIIIYYII